MAPVGFATQGSGLAVLRDDFSGPLFINRETGLKNQVVNQILVQEHDSSLWVATAQGLGHIKLGAWPEKPLEIRWFDRKDGLKSNQVLDLLPFGDYLLVLTSGGLTVLETGDYQEPNLPPTVFLTGLKVGDQAYDYSQSHTLPSDSNSITVNFSALGFRHPGDMRFQYLLEGGDDQWQETPKTELRFSSLSPGNYSLYIMAVDRDRQFSEVPARLDFVIRPPFYQSLWFLLLVGFLILALSVFVYRYLSHKRRKEWLEQKVNEKTIALQNKISELGIANEDLRQFAYVASHDLKTPLRTIVNYLQLLDRRYKGQLDEQADEFIDFAVNSSKQLYQMINDLLIYSELGQEDAQTEYFELGEVLEKVKVNLGDYLKEKNAVLSSCPLPKIMGSRAEWEILLRNLIENGVKFNQSPRPEVRITCKGRSRFLDLVGAGQRHRYSSGLPTENISVVPAFAHHRVPRQWSGAGDE
jgi:signal transduction histidine kinase